MDREAALLLGVDLGYRCGLAVFAAEGTLRSYRSQRFGGRQQIKRGADRVIAEAGPVEAVVVEGEAQLARWWSRAAERAGAEATVVTPETWRAALLHPIERRDGTTAKAAADRLARLAVRELGGPGVTSLRDDAAEAICIGLWGLVTLGWLPALPASLDPARRSARGTRGTRGPR